MNSRALVALLLCGLLAITDSTVVVTGVTAFTALDIAAMAVLAAQEFGANAALLIRGKRHTHEQDLEKDSAMSVEIAQQIDSAGCLAKLLCEVEALPADKLTPAMATFKAALGSPDSINEKESKDIYRLASAFGAKIAKHDPKACDRVFEACPLHHEVLFSILETALSC